MSGQRLLYTNKGSVITLGKQLGRGGEGSVYEIVGSATQVAKLYHEAPTVAKQRKLQYMASSANSDILGYVAWPEMTLSEQPNGRVVGFVMSNLGSKDAVHMVYSPKHRKQDKPHLGWDFLLYVARNIAAAFEALHKHSHVLGDVNQGNVMVGNDSKVVLIDSDSFQVRHGTETFRCEVGVSHFTPPELQGTSGFSHFDRTANHDNFGLALLIFHLLMGGRHPFSGVPLTRQAGDSLESDIAAYRYAYGHDAAKRGIGPPPNSVEMNLLPASTQLLFYKAFTEAGSKAGGRPVASEWLKELDQLRQSLKQCAKVKNHKYPGHQGQCPWCTMEVKGLQLFISVAPVNVYKGTSSGFVLSSFWQSVASIKPPTQNPQPQLTPKKYKPKPPPSGVGGKSSKIMRYVLVGMISIIGIGASPNHTFIILIIGAVVGYFFGESVETKTNEEMKKRLELVKKIQTEVQTIQNTLTGQNSPRAQFNDALKELHQLGKQYEDIHQYRNKLTQEAMNAAIDKQKQLFLDRFYIDNADIPNIGPSRKATLQSYGIETAADVVRQKVASIHGFGPSITASLMDWRARIERRFTPNTSTALTQADRNVIEQKVDAEKKRLETLLLQGQNKLVTISRQSETQIQTNLKELVKALDALGQAEADLEVVRKMM